MDSMTGQFIVWDGKIFAITAQTPNGWLTIVAEDGSGAQWIEVSDTYGCWTADSADALSDKVAKMVDVIDEDGDVVESYDMVASRARSAERTDRIRAERADRRAQGMRERDAERAARVAGRAEPASESAIRDAVTWSARRERNNTRNAARSAMSQLRKSLTL